MIKIFKENDMKVVTNGVYNSLYKPLGYKPFVETKKSIKVETNDIKVEDTSIEANPIEEKIEKTIEESSKKNRRKRGE